jgi:hypothetical protein
MSTASHVEHIDQTFNAMLATYAQQNPTTVLVCEDDAGVRSAFERRLGRDSVKDYFRLRLTDTAEAGRAALAHEKPAVLVTDLRFGERPTGIGLVQQAVAQGGSKVVVFSGFLDDLGKREHFEDMGVRLVQKATPEAEEFWQWLSELPLVLALEQMRNFAGRSTPTVRACQELFATWAHELDAELTLGLGAREFSPQQLVDAVETGNADGERLLRLFVEDLQEDLTRQRNVRR